MVSSWPHLLIREAALFAACLVAMLVLAVYAPPPLEPQANPLRPPNPAKAPWYFLGLQELLHYFQPNSAGVMIPGMTLLALIVLPYVDRNPSRAYADRKVAIVTFTMFLSFWAFVTLAGSFFRGQQWIWTWPWQHIYFDL
jgi:quinol-cytochrome oxidoreductase complex cytochrome b subunit